MSSSKFFGLDGDQVTKAMDSGASAGAQSADLDDGMLEGSKSTTEPKTTGTDASIFSSQGAIGKQFTTQGAVGGTAQKAGGPLDAQGAIGKQFTDKGSVGGTVQDHLAQGKSAFKK